MENILKSYLIVLFFLLTVPVISTAQTTPAKEDTITTASGLQYIVLKKGDGEQAVAGKEVAVNYIGQLMDGKEFDNSYKRGKPFKFVLGKGQVIKGWDEGIALMHAGDKFKLIIPPQLGYGDKGAGGSIPPNATLVFETELMSVSEPKLALADTLLATIFEKGIDSAIVQYHELYKTQKDKYDFDEDKINFLAYRLLRNKMTDDAIAVLKLNAETYPSSPDVYNYLGQTYMMKGDKDSAIQSFEKSLQLNPNNAQVKDILTKLKTGEKDSKQK